MSWVDSRALFGYSALLSVAFLHQIAADIKPHTPLGRMLNLSMNSALATRRMATASASATATAAGQHSSSMNTRGDTHTFDLSSTIALPQQQLHQQQPPYMTSSFNNTFQPIVQNQPLPLGRSISMHRADLADQALQNNMSPRALHQQTYSSQAGTDIIATIKPQESLGSATACSRVGGSNGIVCDAGGERKVDPETAAVVAADTGRILRSSRPSNSSSNASSTREADPDWIPSNMAQSSTTAPSAKKQKKTAAKAASPDNVDGTVEKSTSLLSFEDSSS